MCRHIAWLGRPVSAASLVLDPTHGLKVQSYSPRRQKYGLLNGDGWGLGFFDGEQVRRWRSASPLWSDDSFASVAPALRSGCFLAAVRSATAGMPVDHTAVAPFTDGRYLLSHNGIVNRAHLSFAARAESVVDSAMLAALIFERGLDSLAETVVALGNTDPDARLNLLAADGSRLLATTWGDTLSVLERGDGVVLASEPYDDDPGWRDVPDRHFIEVRNGTVLMSALDGR